LKILHIKNCRRWMFVA